MLSVNSLPNVLTFSCSEVGSNCISPDSFMVHVTAQTRHFIGNPASTIAIQAAFIAQESNLTIKESQHVYFQSVKTKTYWNSRGGEWYFEKRGSRKILAGSQNLGSVFDKSRRFIFSWFAFTFFESRNFSPKSPGLGFLTRISASRRVSDFTIRHP